MNPLLERLQPYPFEKLRALTAGYTPNPAFKPISLQMNTAERPGDLRAEGAPSESGEASDVPGALGLNLQQLTPQISQELSYKGSGKVVVSGVKPGSPADRAGLQRGDIVVEADRRAVEKPGDVAAAAKDGKVLLRVDRKTGSFYTVLSKDED